jgi:hypothetical protein
MGATLPADLQRLEDALSEARGAWHAELSTTLICFAGGGGVNAVSARERIRPRELDAAEPTRARSLPTCLTVSHLSPQHDVVCAGAYGMPVFGECRERQQPANVYAPSWFRLSRRFALRERHAKCLFRS